MKINAKKYLIELSRPQLLSILKAVYLGDWLANAHRTAGLKKEYRETLTLILSLATQFDLEKYATYSEELHNYYHTREFEEETDVEELKQEYDDAMFWEELAHRMGKQAFHKKYSKAEIKKMSDSERFTLLYEQIDAFSEELEEFGLKRLGVIT